MRQHFAAFLGVCIEFIDFSSVDNRRRNGQHGQIGIHLGSHGRFHGDDTNENLEHKLSLTATKPVTPIPELRESFS